MSVYIFNSKGEREPFSFNKAYRSARRVGAPDELARQIARKIEEKAYPGMRTSEIFREIKKLLKRENPRSALRFSLKEAMRRLGPTGFPFEKFIREIFLNENFQVRINQHPVGACGTHYEIDFVAEKGDLIYIGECKYHHLPGERVDLKVILETYARFLDIRGGSFLSLQQKRKKIRASVVTNTKFSKEAVKYARCTGIKLLGWKYPRDGGLERLIEANKLYPITILPSLRGYLKDVFAEKKMMLVKDILNRRPGSLAADLGISEKNILPLVKEAELLMGV